MCPTNHYFQSGTPGGRTSEQRLLENLIIESMRIYGIDAYYCPRKLMKKDVLFGEDVLSQFNDAMPIEMYIKNVSGYGSDVDFASKYGLQIRDRATFVIARQRWTDMIANRGLGILSERPAEGDLIYIPMTNSLFEIKFAEHENPFYQLGHLYVWELECELFVYSSEKLQTGIGEIDEVVTLQSEEVQTYAMKTEAGETLVTENGVEIWLQDFLISSVIVGTDNDQVKQEQDTFLDFTETNPFGEVKL